MSRRGSSWGLGAGALVVGTHTTSVGPGQGVWRRLGGIVDLRSVAKWGLAEIEMRGGVALSAVSVTGRALPATSGTTLFDPGVLIGLRARLRLGRIFPWVEATAVGWPGTHTLFVSGTDSVAELPPFELLVGLGATLMLNP